MRKTLTCGLALALGVAISLPAFAQYGQANTYQNGNSYSSVYQPSTYTPRSGYPLQEQTSPSDLAVPDSAPGMNNVPVPGQQMQQPAAPMMNPQMPQMQPNQGCAPGNTNVYNGNNGVYGGSVVYGDGGCATGGCGPTGYAGSGYGTDAILGNASNSSNWIAGIYGLGFSRDYEDDRALSQNAAGGYLVSTDADLGYFGGLETMIGRRNCNGTGWELSYWGLFPSRTDTTLAGNPTSTLFNLTDVRDPNTGFNVYDIYGNSNNHRIYRDNEFHNVEWNFLRNAGSTCSGNFEWLAGFRWFEFDESYRYATFTAAAGYPTDYFYDLDVQNTLLGFQMGGRRDFCVSNKLRVHVGAKAGLFNNYIRARQNMRDNLGNYAQIANGAYANTEYNFRSNKNDVAMVGELDLGMSYQIKSCLRFRGGYRAIGVSGVALAPDQIPYSFQDIDDINRIKSNGSLILHGFYAGAEYCF